MIFVGKTGTGTGGRATAGFISKEALLEQGGGDLVSLAPCGAL